ncbi:MULTISPECIES: hypothetical protein [unclassified Devosia]|uniref:hypothetical protein n=1 Tax=unclassified Devosia TaxID=196773 RepID=UPI001AC18BAF|nr:MULTISPECIES: hypothetical protein [unclassified Devosia]MBN9304482.1 hypothetical protein [Devosia sp.]
MAQSANFLEELMAAGRGLIRLLVGDRRAGSYFDFSQRGLAGSFIALLIVAGLDAVLPLILSSRHDSIATSMFQLVVIYGFQLGFTTLVLRQLKRMDALLPYMVSYNWLNFFATLILGAIFAAGIGASIAILVIGIMAIVIEVNIARLVMTLSPLHIAFMIGAQIIGVLIGLLLLMLLFPLPPDVAAELTTAGL